MRKPFLFLLLSICFLPGYDAAARPAGQDASAGAVQCYDFDAGPNMDWKPLSGAWTMIDGAYTVSDIEDDALYLSSLQSSPPSDMLLSADIHPGNSGGFTSRAMVFVRMSDQKNGFCFWMDSRYGSFYRAGWNALRKGKWDTPEGVAGIKTPVGKAVQVEIEMKGNLFRASVDGKEVSRVYDSSFSSGAIGIGQIYTHWYMENPRIAFDNVRVGPLGHRAASPGATPPGPARAAGAPPEKAVSETGADARSAEAAAFRAERAAQRAEQAAKAAQDAAKRSESMAGKAEGIMEKATAK
ncbi:MAG: hypothetical protein JXL84_22170 [Deltaproteobacteria bacterium]|nr:hypothetical protein [Deltaproteobacteria bacterium]